ncbi:MULTISPECIES: helix-turn-helix domain-containing protein [Sphingobacterium]|uniref:HTH cro/C1-type domain-containing protein n=1 Tax=Sphingobacterium athyrii TaxID=2152717 RepID=A0A363NL76_9SPHI|nr:helix-turn-helix transcriptional regulator [Sphingobacterium sp. DR205]PUV21576.1 hypothetical protein DCO56_24820 [Sphingobacterium athyrii]QIH35980.1 helix-turn-helix transcriptional regulator [Sphingobacterium sp. DR205]
MKKSNKKIDCPKLIIGPVLKRHRIQHGYTQNEIADLIHVSRPCYSSWENDYHEIPLSKLPQLAECYNLDLMSLIAEIIQEDSRTHKNQENFIAVQITNLNSDIIQMKKLLGEILIKQNDGYFI